MSLAIYQRTASYEEIAAEMDRRGRVIEDLEKENETLRSALKLSDPERRQLFITLQLRKFGFFNRIDIIDTFGVSVPQASLDIRKWLETNPTGAQYNASRKRYEVAHV